MASPFDDTDFVDRDYLASRQPGSAGTPSPFVSAHPQAGKPPTREELETRVSDAHQRLAELKHAQEVLERERATLEEARRRRAELETGRSEMIQHLTRGIGLLEEAELAARRDAEGLSQTLLAFRDATSKLQSIREDQWSEETWNVELTRALTAIENARMEYNAARVKWPVLTAANRGPNDPSTGDPTQHHRQGQPLHFDRSTSFLELCRIGFAMTWPLATVTLIAALLLWLALRRH